jgi:hypothetical protein
VKIKTEAELKRALQAKEFDEVLRQETVKYSQAAAAAGETVTAVAARLGMKPNTLHRWHQRARKAESPAIDFVEVEGARSGEGLEVVWPTGHLIRLGSGNLKAVFLALEATCCPRE